MGSPFPRNCGGGTFDKQTWTKTLPSLKLPIRVVNMLLFTSDHRLFKKHMHKFWPTVQKYANLLTVKLNWRFYAPFKISLLVLYSIVWIWGLTGKILEHLSVVIFIS